VTSVLISHIMTKIIDSGLNMYDISMVSDL